MFTANKNLRNKIQVDQSELTEGLAKYKSTGDYFLIDDPRS